MTIIDVEPETRSAPQVSAVNATKAMGLADEAAAAAALVAAARRHEEWAWAALVERYRGLLTSITWSYHMSRDDAAEIHQIVWVRLFESIDDIRDAGRIAGWIRTVAGNECRRMTRKYRREIFGMDDADIDRESEETVWGSLLADERQAALRRALVRMSGKGRMLLESQLADPELPYAELAIRLDMARGSIGPTRQRCLRQLRAAPELAEFAG